MGNAGCKKEAREVINTITEKAKSPHVSKLNNWCVLCLDATPLFNFDILFNMVSAMIFAHNPTLTLISIYELTTVSGDFNFDMDM